MMLLLGDSDPVWAGSETVGVGESVTTGVAVGFMELERLSPSVMVSLGLTYPVADSLSVFDRDVL